MKDFLDNERAWMQATRIFSLIFSTLTDKVKWDNFVPLKKDSEKNIVDFFNSHDDDGAPGWMCRPPVATVRTDHSQPLS